MVVSEPLGDVPGVERSARVDWGVIQPGQDEMHAFEPVAPALSA